MTEQDYPHFKLWRKKGKWPSYYECDFAMIGKRIRYINIYPHSLSDVCNFGLVFTDGSKVKFRLIDYKFEGVP